jgi:hypothetical protein
MKVVMLLTLLAMASLSVLATESMQAEEKYGSVTCGGFTC